jgi:hypothetical protein
MNPDQIAQIQGFETVRLVEQTVVWHRRRDTGRIGQSAPAGARSPFCKQQ